MVEPLLLFKLKNPDQKHACAGPFWLVRVLHFSATEDVWNKAGGIDQHRFFAPK